MPTIGCAIPNVYAQWYGESHDDLAHLAQAVYGLPEIYGDEIATAQLVANPGCYPQTAILGLAPLVAGKHIDLKRIIVDSKSGVSGAGRTPKLTTHFPECNESVVAYNVGSHRHTPEIEQALTDVAGEPVEVIFTPHLIPMDRGIFTTIYATPHRPMTQAQLAGAVPRVLRASRRSCAWSITCRRRRTRTGTNFLDVTVRVVRDRDRRAGVRDNLVRGASGVAVQNFNRMYGFDERTAPCDGYFRGAGSSPARLCTTDAILAAGVASGPPPPAPVRHAWRTRLSAKSACFPGFCRRRPASPPLRHSAPATLPCPLRAWVAGQVA